jgi:hypothetical protein
MYTKKEQEISIWILFPQPSVSSIELQQKCKGFVSPLSTSRHADVLVMLLSDIQAWPVCGRMGCRHGGLRRA